MSEYFDKIRVLDLSLLLPGPYCTMLLGDLGMDVIKVEDTKHGDLSRKSGGAFKIINRNKKSLAIDLKSEEGKAIFLDLVKDSDVIVEGFRPGVMERLGLGYEKVKEINPRIIYCSISGFGQTGEYRDRPGHDLNFLAMAGMVGIPTQMEMSTSRPATRVADLTAGLTAALSILAALLDVKTSHEGQYIDISMTDVMASWVALFLPVLIKDGAPVSKEDCPLLIPGNDMYETQDHKWLTIGMNEDKFWNSLIHCLQEEFPAMGVEHWKKAQERNRRKVELHYLLKGIILSKPYSYWEHLFNSSDFPWAPVHNAVDVMNEPLFRERGIIGEMLNPLTGQQEYQVGFPALFSKELNVYRTSAPDLGENTVEILEQYLNYGESKINNLAKRSIVKINSPKAN
jgi:crotonobetainyl-CoA:carnitine CoA-transferase CaiB-like acyl-CoA transferase